MVAAPAVEFRELSKRFPGVLALDRVSWTLAPGEIHALLGENGAGKSTLLRILAGDHRPDGGELVLPGTGVDVRTPADAHDARVRVIYQEPNLLMDRSVAENVLIGALPARRHLVDRRRLHELAAEQARRLGVDIDVTTRVRRLGPAARQLVEIMKALASDVRVLALDEPTSSLSGRETERLFAILRTLRSDGVGIVYVSHRLEEVREIADRATVMRDGRVVGTVSVASTTDAELIRMMIGRQISTVFATPDTHGDGRGDRGTPRLAVTELRTGSVGPVSLTVRAGEVVGIAGLVGSGRSKLVRALAGAEPLTGGEVRVDGRPVRSRGPSGAIAAGIAVCPEDRRALALVPDRSVRENILLGHRTVRPRLGFLRVRRREVDRVERYLRLLDIRPADPEARVRTLSGGNQQKVVLARWLAREPSVLILDEPTRGIDVGAKSEIYALIRRLTADGLAVLVVSSELVEVIGLADRVYVMRGGRVAGEVPRAEATEESLLTLALGTNQRSRP
ncbi:sugar ABC transporter ATP-binding protein [Jiangella asiatica]|uniref:Sugar ABC transporter ATP-binding protein n=1 Tax=Jiangella asiatica TaxID=2530372 RepID=A0A4R5DHI3_9ACTN|nr:sugar ABC transporter ATP-binding protein [Jiangella asiatica]